VAVERPNLEKRPQTARERVLQHPDVQARAKAILEAFRRGEASSEPPLNEKDLPDFLRDHA
jgi:hypothetical protein